MTAAPGASDAGRRAEPLLRASGLTRRFPGVLALDDVGLVGHAGEVLALVGENGAGKSTLLKLLAGVDQPDGGEMHFGGAPWRPATPRAAAAGGVALVHQELCLAENLSAAANISLGREPRRFGFVKRARVREIARTALDRVGALFDPESLVASLSAGERQLVEIAKGLAEEARVLILDEPTSSLTMRETERLFEVVKKLRAEGVLVIYVSHRLGEVLELADRAIVLRDGKNAGELEGETLTRAGLVRSMVGREEAAVRARSFESGAGSPALQLEALRTEDWPSRSVNLSVAPGEIVGLAGLVGAGRTELLETIFGLRAAQGGAVRLGGEAFAPAGPRGAIAAGVALVPEDRKEHGLLLEDPVRVNLALATLASRRRGPLVDGAAERAAAEAAVGRLGIRTSSIEQVAGTLSGGNQQKVVIGRWLETAPRVLLLDEPTRGVDVGAREELYALLEDLASSGLSVLFASSDLEELLRLADRIVVMHEGAIAGELPRSEANETRVMELATGGTSAGIDSV